MRTRKAERLALHGPWPGEEDEAALERLREDFPDWRFWRSVSQERKPGEWNAQRRSGGAPVTADSERQLRKLLGGGE